MPLASAMTWFDVGGQECPVVRESRTFQPLHHAICAISMLSLAFKGQRQLFAGAFRHYHQAITTCISPTIKPAGSLIYLHYILLNFDVCCASQRSALGGQMWAQHFQRLSRLIYSSNDVNELQAHLLSYTLYLDAQSCLAGNTESGAFVRTYQMQGSRLPICHEPRNSLQTISLESSEADIFAACFALSNFMRAHFADLSQSALRIRQDVDMGHGDLAEHQRHISNCRDELRTSWKLNCPRFLLCNSSKADANLLPLTKKIFDFASLQYSSALIYLHTSMYRGQQVDASYLQHKEISSHCRFVLAKANLIISSGATEQNYVIFPVFLAGVASSNDHDQNSAIGIIRALERTGISSGACRSRQLLEAICVEQRRLVQCGGSAAEVDWVSYSNEMGLRRVNMGL
ncbi:hypothetical protein E4T44_01037 [Aureobasidium sp. EXF-8845]|nr:hypothetical protein E4T44_01037 [Aureobasidium sp. EXF-8845]KAI4857503.1 hypothetical protein E4T45_01001 [Aureobasidium sp. EXF-8846]